MSDKTVLKLDWCSYAAAKYAVEHWHYSKSMPTPPLVKIGVWEQMQYIGCVLFSRGASTNLLKPYGLSNIQGCELTRIALALHKASVSKIVSIALRLLAQFNPGLRLIVSYADPFHEHLGIIYQAGNWVYTGTSSPDRAFIDQHGKQYHSRMIAENGSGYRKQFGVLRKCRDAKTMTKVILPGKHRYLYPLDAAMRAQILPLAQPYPKRAASIPADAPAVQAGESGAAPTAALSSCPD